MLLFTKPARPGAVKTRLIGELSPEQAAGLHAAFRDDLLERLGRGAFELRVAWALEDGEAIPKGPLPGVRQTGHDLGERLFAALSDAGRTAESVGAVGSDHPLLAADAVEAAFERLESGAQVVFGPATDGGYYLVAARSDALRKRLFEEIPWSTSRVLERTLERCGELALSVELLPEESDVDTPEDLVALCRALTPDGLECPRTRARLRDLGLLAQ